MRAPLEKYLNDHLAGAAFAIDLLEALCRKHRADAFSEPLQSLLVEIRNDREELAALAIHLGLKRGGLKEKVARFFAKLSRPKLVSRPNDAFSSFEAFETLALGILGKTSLWEALSTLPVIDDLRVDLDRLKRRAKDQHAVVEQMRLSMAPVVLARH